ncbi:MAG: hypothetical protein V1492_02270 [Candidatus Micrarchaeota archaeon]
MRLQLKITDPNKREQILGEICARHGFKGNGIDKKAPLLERLSVLREYASTVGNKETVRKVEAYERVVTTTKVEDNMEEQVRVVMQASPQSTLRKIFNKIKDGAIPALVSDVALVALGAVLVAKVFPNPELGRLVHMGGWLLTVLGTAETVKSAFLFYQDWYREKPEHI